MYTSPPLDRSPSLSSNSSGSAVSSNATPTPDLPSSSTFSSFPSAAYPRSKDDIAPERQFADLSLNQGLTHSPSTATIRSTPRSNGAGEKKANPWSAGHRTGAGSQSFDAARARFGDVGRSPSFRFGGGASPREDSGKGSSSPRSTLHGIDTNINSPGPTFAHSPSSLRSTSPTKALPPVPPSPTHRSASPFSSGSNGSGSRPNSPTKLSGQPPSSPTKSTIPFPAYSHYCVPPSPSQPQPASSASARAMSSSIFATSPGVNGSPEGGLGRMGSMRRFDSVGSASGGTRLGHRRAMTLPHNSLLGENGLPSAQEVPEELGGTVVAGLPGRARLSRPAEAPSSFAPSAVFSSSHGLSSTLAHGTPTPPLPSGSLLPSQTVRAIERQRQNLVAYEYLCHCLETQEWLEEVMPEKARQSELWVGTEDGIGGFVQSLRNGYALAHLARMMGSKEPPAPTQHGIFNDPVLQFRHTQNINMFFALVKEIKLPKVFHFETVDLYEAKDLPRVIYCIHAVAALLFKMNMASGMTDLVGTAEFTDADLQATERGLDGVRMPNFRGIGKALEKHEPVVETSEQRQERELAAALPGIVGLQAHARGALARSRYFAYRRQVEAAERRRRAEAEEEERRAELTRLEDERRRQEEEARLAREAETRRVEEERRLEQLRREEEERARLEAVELEEQRYQAAVREAAFTMIKFQALARGVIARRQVDHLVNHLRQHESAFVGLQAHARGALARRSYDDTLGQLGASVMDVVGLQAAARGALARQRVLGNIRRMKSSQDFLVGVQAAIRGQLARQSFAGRKRHLRTAEVVRSVGGFQSLARAALVRRSVDVQRQALGFVEPDVVGIQAQTRGYLGRRAFLAWRDHIYRHEEAIVDLQSIIRGFLARRKYYEVRAHFQRNMGAVVRMQAFVRSRQQGDQYRQLRMGTNVPASTIKNFVHLLDDSEFDYRGEVQVETMRKQLVGMIRETQGLEDDVKDLDTKIALLVKNKITHEVARAQRSGAGGLAPLRRDSLLAAAKDPFASDTLDRQTQRKLELYQQLFWHLQTAPKYFARLFANGGRSDRGDKAQKALEGITFGVFSFAQSQREEYLLLKLFQRSIQQEMQFLPNIGAFVKGNLTFVRLLMLYGREVNQRKSLQTMLSTPVKQIMAAHAKPLSTDPVAIYRGILAEEETRTGIPSSRPREVDWRYAVSDQATNAALVHNMTALRHATEVLLRSIMASTASLPFGIRFIVREVFRTLREAFPEQPEGEMLRVAGHLIYYRFIQPAIVAPETFSIIESVVPDIQRHNLAECAKLINQISAGRAFEADQPWMQTFNRFIEVKTVEFAKWIRDVIHVADAEAHFRADEWLDAKSSRQPVIYISPNDIYTLHSAIVDCLDVVAPEPEDPVRTILSELGGAPIPASGELSRARADEVPLTLITRIAPQDDPGVADKALFQQAKRRIVAVLKVHHGANLVAVFAQPVVQQDEEAWGRIVQEELREEERQARAARRSVIQPVDDIRRLSFHELKIAAVQDLMTLRSRGVVSQADNFQAILDSIAQDIKLKHHRRIQRSAEIQTMHDTLTSLRSKKTYLVDQIRSYHEYIDQSMASIQRKSKKRIVLPWSLQAAHQRQLEKKGKRYAFGSYKYTAQDLYDRGILLSIDQFSPRQFDKVTLSISSDEVGVFEVTAAYMGANVTTVELKLEDLLEAQFAAKQTLSIGGVAKVNLNLLVHLINKKFYA